MIMSRQTISIIWRNFFVKMLSAVFCLILVSGCASSSKPLPQIDENPSLRAFTKQLVRITTPSAIDRMLEAVTMKEHETESFIQMSGWWCPDHVNIDRASGVRMAYANACAELGGVLEDGFCRSSGAPDDVLFYVKAVNGRRCSLGYPATELVVVEPKGDLHAKEYLAQLKRFGFQSRAAQIAAKAQAEDRRQDKVAAQRRAADEQQARLERQRRANESLSVGDRVCRRGLFQYHTSAIGSTLRTEGSMVAQFEAHSPDKMRLQVRVLRAELPELASRYKAQPIDVPRLGDLEAIAGILYWDDAGNWQMC